MPKSSQRKTRSNSEMRPTSEKLDKIDSWLQTMLDRFPQKGQISTEEIQDWHHDLSPFSLAAIDFSFESHRTNALFFPMVRQILDLCISYDPPAPINTLVCDATCRARHGKGYSWKDMYAAYEMMRQAVEKKKPIDSEAILSFIDSKRENGAPEFRR
jgi:hypothetical protein